MKRFSSIFMALLVVAFSSVAVFAEETTDTENPSDVENVEATAMDSAVKLTWDAATDDTGVVGYVIDYGTNSVETEGQTYDMSVEVENVTEYTVEGLENGTTYYFGIYAFDAEDNQSLRWSVETSATPEEGGGGEDEEADTEAPTVSNAEAVNKYTVKVVFSEEVVLPEETPEMAFSIEDDDNLEALVVEAAVFDDEDATNKTVILTTKEQVENASYKLTVGIDLEDKAGNQVVSGTSDTAPFTGSGEEPEEVDEEGPKITQIQRVDHKTITVSFDETIVLGIDPSANFIVHAEGDESDELEVMNVTPSVNSEGTPDANVVIDTAEQETKTYIVKAMGITDVAGNSIANEDNSVTFAGEAEVVEEEEEEEEEEHDGQDEHEHDEDEHDHEEDEHDHEEDEHDHEEEVIEPKDIANLLAKVVMDAQKFNVTLTWKVPTENEGLVREQVVYRSEGNADSYEEEAVVDADVESYEVEGLEPGSYWFKITQRDSEGNETEGVIKKVILSETGPGMLGLLAFSIGAGRVFRRKK